MILKQLLAPHPECPHCKILQEEFANELQQLTSSYQLKLRNARTELAARVMNIRKSNSKKIAQEGFRLVAQELNQLKQQHKLHYESNIQKLIEIAEARSARIYNTGLLSLIKRSRIINKALTKLLKQSFKQNILELYVHPNDYHACQIKIQNEAPELSACLHSSEQVTHGNLKCKLRSNSEISYDWQQDFSGIIN